MFGFGKKKIFTLKAPLSGKPVPLENVPDPAFAERLVGDGGAIEPSGDLLVAPCDGTVAVLFPTGHAV
ncbi:MAG: PTS glucose transporter subunit IIA, partial [Synergistaceae bacterium]|nr:PTS glucose transporter subunit IIA [Synergistaceae bacterium]